LIGILEHHLQIVPQHAQSLRCGLQDILALKQHLSCGRLHKAQDAARQRGLARPAFPDKSQRLSGHQVKGDIADGLHAALCAEKPAMGAEDLEQAAYRKQWFGHGATLFWA